MSKVDFSKIPNEMLAEVFSYMVSNQDALSCRLVSRHWNSLASKFWRQLPSTQAQISTERSMAAFLSFMNSRIQDFPFKRIRFSVINSKRIDAARTLLIKISSFIEDIHINTINGQTRLNSHLFLSFIEQLDISSMPNLVKLRIDSSYQILTPSTLCLEKLHTLDMPISTEPMKRLCSFLVKSSPNLKQFITFIEVRRLFHEPQIPVWQLGDEYKKITVIQVKLKLKIRLSYFLEIFSPLVQKLDDWKNIQVTELYLEVFGFGDIELLDAPKAKESIENLIQAHSDSIRHLEIENTILGIKLPVMRNLETFHLNSGYNTTMGVGPIEGSPFPRLRSIILNWYYEPSEVFRTAVFESVKTFTLINPRHTLNFDVHVWTAWAKVFPKLESFAYINEDIDDWFNGRLYFQHVFSSLRQESLTQISVQAPRYFSGRQIPEIRNILSGFTNFQEVLDGAVLAKDTAGKIEEDAYWTRMEALRTPCLTNLTTLTSLYLDVQMDDGLASEAICRMKPLNELTIHSKNLSQEAIQKLNDRHRQPILLYYKAKKLKRSRR